MKKVAIVSCDKWINKLEEDKNLKEALIELGIDAKIISWQKPLEDNYDLLILKSVWGYQNYYNEFKEWLLYIKANNIPIVNDVDMILNNVMKDVQFAILEENNIDFIDTTFLEANDLRKEENLNQLEDKLCVVKPTISGSGDNTYILCLHDENFVSNKIKKEDIIKIYNPMLSNNKDCKIMFQPFVSEINNGEYSCIFIEGELTHTMLRFPGIFQGKKTPYLVTDVPTNILNLAKKVERIQKFNNYLYMRVDMVIVDGEAKIMEVELADPDLLTKYIENENVKSNIIKTFAKRIERRII